MSHAERDETLRMQAQFARVQHFIEELLRDGLSFEDVTELLHRGVAAAEYQRRHEGGSNPCALETGADGASLSCPGSSVVSR